MRFSRLRLAGFKSFVEPAELRIEPGLTGVVGPNGCGKSNLLEALRWVMGEGSPKSMRSGGMDDVIFAGTARRPSRDFAEVCLTLDNDLRRAPAAFNDAGVIEVTRRIDRGAGSAYRINGRDVRQRDVQLLFADAATGAHSPALVSQGRIGAIVSAKPQERRLLLEEAAGIAGLHVRRGEAEIRLRAASANLTRVDDMLAGLETQANALKRQAKAAERYIALSARIRVAEAQTLFARWRAAAAAADAARVRAAAAEAQVADATRETTRLSAGQTAAAAALPALRHAEAEAAAALQHVIQTRGQLAARLAAAETRLRELAAAAAQLAADDRREAGLAADAAAAIARLAAEADALYTSAAAARAALPAAAATVTTAENTASAAEQMLAHAVEAQARAAAENLAATAARDAASARAARAEAEAARLAAEVGTLARDAADARPAAAATLAAAATAAAQASAEVTAADTARTIAAAARDAAATARAEARAAHAVLAAERAALLRALAATPTASASAAESITVAPGYEAALAAALGDDLSAALGQGSRAWHGSNAAADPPLPAGAEPLALKVAAPPELARRLAQIGVVADGAGIPLAPGQRLVSRDGKLWRWDGFYAAGGAGQTAAERFAQRNRLVALEAELAPAAASLAASEATADTTETGLRAATAAAETARDARARAEAAHDAARAALGRAAAAADQRRGRAAALAAAIARLTDEAQVHARDTEAAAASLVAAPPLADLAIAAHAARAAAQRDRAALADARATHDRLARALAADDARALGLTADRDGWGRRAAAGAAQRAELAARAAAVETERAALAQTPAALAADAALIADRVAAAEAARAAAADTLAAADAALRALDAQARVAADALGAAREARARDLANAEHDEARRADAAAQATERLGHAPVALPQAFAFDPGALGDPEALARHHDALAAERERIGPVNLVAAAELAEIEATVAASSAEREELETAIARLRGSIGSLNREGRVRLLEAFKSVDAHFRDLFSTLFAGGAAHLELIEADDPLDAGLEIMAQPPGKKLQSLTLLSGGEQALTAVALIFALFLTNPSPVCVLDEVDAPLDDANVERFCDLLDRVSGATDTRFLIVTHNAVTMSRMHRLYGVTMVEQGISQLVSVDLARAGMLLAAE